MDSQNTESLLAKRCTAIVNYLCTYQTASSKEIADGIGVPASTTYKLCSYLKQLHVIQASGNRHIQRGRSQQLFSLNSSFQSCIVVDIELKAIDGYITGIDNSILYHAAVSSESFHDKPNHIDLTLNLIDELKSWASDHQIPCKGLSLIVPGSVKKNGVVSTASELSWMNVSLGDILRVKYQDPIFIINNANAFAMGESMKHQSSESNRKVLVGLVIREFGVGTGLIVNNQMINGVHGSAGEIGFSLTNSNSFDSYYTLSGDLETRLRDEFVQANDNKERAYDTIISLISMAIANICVLLDPDTVFFDIAPNIKAYIDLEKVHEKLVGRIPYPPNLVEDTASQESRAIGASALVTAKVRTTLF